MQRAFMFLSIFWIVLLFYKSLLVVELLRYDVNISRETVDALIPKPNFLSPAQIKDNLMRIFSEKKSFNFDDENLSSDNSKIFGKFDS